MHWFSCYFVASVVRTARSDEWYALHYTGWVSFAVLHRNGSPEWGGAPLMSGNAAPQDSRTILLRHFSLPLFLFSREEGEEGRRRGGGMTCRGDVATLVARHSLKVSLTLLAYCLFCLGYMKMNQQLALHSHVTQFPIE